MRATPIGIFVAVLGVVLAIGPAASAKDSAGVFPDLPGLGMVEEVTTDRAPDLAKGTTTQNSSAAQSMPAPDPKLDAAKITLGAVQPDQIAVVTALPGGGGLPILKDVAKAGALDDGLGALIAFAALFCIAFTRWLYRLNELGARAV